MGWRRSLWATDYSEFGGSKMTENRSLGSKAFDVFNLIFLIILTLLCLLPLWYTLMIALSDKAAVQAGIVSVYPIGFNLYSFQAILVGFRFL